MLNKDNLNGEIIAITNNTKGGLKTFTIIHMGIALASKGKKVLLVDMDPCAPMTTFFGAPKKTNVLKMAENTSGDIGEAIVNCREGLDIIPANKQLLKYVKEKEKIKEKAVVLKNYLERLKVFYDCILIDTAGETQGVEDIAIMAAESVLYPISLDIHTNNFEEKDTVKEFLTQCEIFNRAYECDIKIKGMFFTHQKRCAIFQNRYERYILEKYSEQIRIYDTELPDIKEANELLKKKKTLFECCPHDSLTRRYILLSMEILFL